MRSLNSIITSLLPFSFIPLMAEKICAKGKALFMFMILFTLSSCDPIYVGELRNHKSEEIEIKICGSDLSFVNWNKSGKEITFTDSTKQCKIIRLAMSKTMPIAQASGIAKPITYKDLGFDELEITTSSGHIRATGKEIVDLFEIEKKTNIFGLHAFDLNYIDIGKSKEN